MKYLGHARDIPCFSATHTRSSLSRVIRVYIYMCAHAIYIYIYSRTGEALIFSRAARVLMNNLRSPRAARSENLSFPLLTLCLFSLSRPRVWAAAAIFAWTHNFSPPLSFFSPPPPQYARTFSIAREENSMGKYGRDECEKSF